MRTTADPSDDASEAALQTLFRAIAACNLEEATRLLAAYPGIATRAAKVGATRADATTHYFAEIGHYAYAGDTALHLAAAAHRCETARELIALGASPCVRNRRGAEPLHYAADAIPGSPAWNPEAQGNMVELLIRAGANPNACDKAGVAPLHRAVRTRATAAVAALLENGADARLRNKSGSTPLHLAVQETGRGGTGSAAARDEQHAIIRLLVEHGARATDEDARGKRVSDCVTADWIRTALDPR